MRVRFRLCNDEVKLHMIFVFFLFWPKLFETEIKINACSQYDKYSPLSDWILIMSRVRLDTDYTSCLSHVTNYLS